MNKYDYKVMSQSYNANKEKFDNAFARWNAFKEKIKEMEDEEWILQDSDTFNETGVSLYDILRFFNDMKDDEYPEEPPIDYLCMPENVNDPKLNWVDDGTEIEAEPISFGFKDYATREERISWSAKYDNMPEYFLPDDDDAYQRKFFEDLVKEDR